MTKSNTLPRGAWLVVALLWVLALLNYLDRQLIVTMSDPIMTELGLDAEQFGLFSSVFLWVYAGCSPLAGFIADRFGRRRMIFSSVVVWSAATLATGFAPNFQWMLAARAVMGISEAFYIPAAVAFIVEYHRGQTRSLATGLHLSGIYAGSILGGLGGWMAGTFGWRSGFVLFGAFGIAYGLFLTLILKNPPADDVDLPSREPLEHPKLVHTFLSLLSSRGFLLLLAAFACVGTAGWTIRNWGPRFFSVELNVDIARAGIYGATVLSIFNFAGMLAGGVLSDRWSLSNPRVRTLLPAFGYCTAAVFFFGIGVMPTVALVLLAIAVYGIAQGVLDSNMMPAVCTVVQSRHRATAYGLLNFVGTSCGGLMTYVGGWLSVRGVTFAAIFQGVSLFVVLAGLFLLSVKPKREALDE